MDASFANPGSLHRHLLVGLFRGKGCLCCALRSRSNRSFGKCDTSSSVPKEQLSRNFTGMIYGMGSWCCLTLWWPSRPFARVLHATCRELPRHVEWGTFAKCVMSNVISLQRETSRWDTFIKDVAIYGLIAILSEFDVCVGPSRFIMSSCRSNWPLNDMCVSIANLVLIQQSAI